MTIEVVASPGEAERDAVLRILVAHNEASVGPTERQQVAIVVRDDAGTITSGLWGKIGYRWLFVEFLAVSPDHKRQGIGRALMQRAETLARDAGCIGIWLDTFSFQARGFYEKLGFGHFGTIDDFPPGHARFFLSKRID